MQKLNQLTFTRFLAALTVVFFHAGGSVFPLNIYPITPLFTSGTVSVSYFFVLSGFILAFVYYRPEEKFDFGVFWGARFARIYPVYLFSFALVSLYYIDTIAKIKPAKIWASLLLIQAWMAKYALSFNIAAWSLSVEIFFYFIFPFFIIWTYRQPLRRLIELSLAFWVLSQIIHFGLLNTLAPANEHFLAYNPLFHLNAFLLGVVGGVWFQTKPVKHPVNQQKNRWFLIGSLLLTGILLIFGANQAKETSPLFRISLMNGLLAPIFLVTVITLALDQTRLSKILSHHWLLLLGEASYALYIIHIPIRWLYEKVIEAAYIEIPYTVFFYTYLISVIALSILVHKWIEIPSRIWIRKQFQKGLSSSQAFILLANGLVIFLSVNLSFLLRLGQNHALDFYAPAIKYMLAISLFVRLSLFSFKNVSITSSSHFFKQTFLKTTLGTAIIASLMYALQSTGSIAGFPRSVLLIDYFLIIGLSTLLEYAFNYLRKKRAATTTFLINTSLEG